MGKPKDHATIKGYTVPREVTGPGDKPKSNWRKEVYDSGEEPQGQPYQEGNSWFVDVWRTIKGS